MGELISRYQTVCNCTLFVFFYVVTLGYAENDVKSANIVKNECNLV
jgi:hypothetical protein